MEREGRLWGPAQIERVRVHGVELVMMRRPYNFLEKRGQSLKGVEDREEELELVQDYDMFSAYPFLTERTPQEKVIEAPIFQDLDVLFSFSKKDHDKKRRAEVQKDLLHKKRHRTLFLGTFKWKGPVCLVLA